MGTASGMMVEENLAIAARRGKKLSLRWGFRDESTKPLFEIADGSADCSQSRLYSLFAIRCRCDGRGGNRPNIQWVQCGKRFLWVDDLRRTGCRFPSNIRRRNKTGPAFGRRRYTGTSFSLRRLSPSHAGIRHSGNHLVQFGGRAKMHDFVRIIAVWLRAGTYEGSL